MSPAQMCMLLVLVSCSSQAEAMCRQTQLRSSYDRAFSRRKRAIIFPPGSFFKFTLNFSKGLLSTYPRGITFNLEEAVYFPIPGTRDDLYPKRFLPKTSTTTAPKTTTPLTFVYIPGTDWRFKAQALPKPKYGQKPHRMDYGSSYKWPKGTKYKANYAQKWQPDSNPAKWSKWTTPAPQWTREWTGHWRRFQPVDENHRHFHGHRDRRQLFEHFSELSGLFGLDVKSCILRTICDSKQLLLPPGYSMLQDMLRLVFTMPRLDGLQDEYTRIMSMEANRCASELRTKCNMNLLIWLLSGRLE